jgi:hypothetical protein
MTATELKTAEMILALKQVARARYGGTPHCLPSRAADWLYHLQTQLGKIYQERDEARAEVERLKRELEQAIAERTPHDYKILAEQRDQYKEMYLGALKEIAKARAEVEEVKKRSINAVTLSWDGPALTGGGGGVSPSAGNNHHVPAATKMIRAEPSRLEIAAMFMAPKGSFYTAKLALEEADALIRVAAKGGAK